MTRLDQARIEFKTRAHRGGKWYIQQILRDTEQACGSGPRGMDSFIIDHIGLEDNGLDIKWFRRVRITGSLKVDRAAKDLWIRIGRYIADNGFWPTQFILQNFAEWEKLRNGTRIPLPQSSSSSSNRRKRRAAAAAIKAQQEKERLEEELKARNEWQLQLSVPDESEELTDSEDYVGLNFRVPEDFAWEFKQAALSAKKKQNAFLYELLAAHKKIEEIEKSLTLIKDTVDREVREVMDRLLSLENRLQHVESLEPYINDIWRMIDTATAPAMANGKADSKEQVERK